MPVYSQFELSPKRNAYCESGRIPMRESDEMGTIIGARPKRPRLRNDAHEREHHRTDSESVSGFDRRGDEYVVPGRWQPLLAVTKDLVFLLATVGLLATIGWNLLIHRTLIFDSPLDNYRDFDRFYYS